MTERTTPPGGDASDASADARWQESDSRRFIRLGDLFTPWRKDLTSAFLTLVPATPDDDFLAVDLACGTGWLAEALLRAFPRSRLACFDVSAEMLVEAQARLALYQGRATFDRFDLFDAGWRIRLSEPARAIVSCLAIHHLGQRGKQRLFRQLADALAPGGALLIADIVRPTSELARRWAARSWDAAVRSQAAATGADDAYESFVADGWNYFEHMDDPIDRPSPLLDQLRWLERAGLAGVDAFWMAGGHALFGGYRPPANEAQPAP